MSVKLQYEHHFEFQLLKVAVQDRLSLHLSKCHIDGNHITWHILVSHKLVSNTRAPVSLNLLNLLQKAIK